MPLAKDALRAIVEDQLTQCCTALCAPFVHGRSPGVCDALLYTFWEMAQCVDIPRHDGPWTAFVAAFEALPQMRTYLDERPARTQHAFFARLNFP